MSAGLSAIAVQDRSLPAGRMERVPSSQWVRALGACDFVSSPRNGALMRSEAKANNAMRSLSSTEE